MFFIGTFSVRFSMDLQDHEILVESNFNQRDAFRESWPVGVWKVKVFILSGKYEKFLSQNGSYIVIKELCILIKIAGL